ncbi:MAG: hypothetical protein Q8M03_11460 [Legionella sp.]|nr:hypothetical protein [Legionella sp.]
MPIPRITTVPLQVEPEHIEVPSLTGSPVSRQTAGTVLYGYYSMEYRLPDGDRLRLIASHNHANVQIFLLTHDPEKLQNLPGARPSSLVADMISRVNRYLIRADSYEKPRAKAQEAKYRIAQSCIQSLGKLLKDERELNSSDWAKQEALRAKVIACMEWARDENRVLANNPVISEGALGNMLYDAKQIAQQYQFNRVFPVSRLDQLDFTHTRYSPDEKVPCYVWDSEIHIGYDEEAINDTLRVICQQYGLDPGKRLSNMPANRFKRLENFFYKLWEDGKDWVSHLAHPHKPKPVKHTSTRLDGLSKTNIKPYYRLKGLQQSAHPTLEDLMESYVDIAGSGFIAGSIENAHKILTFQGNGSWAQIRGKNQVIVRLNNQMTPFHYYEENEQFYPLPNGDDLYNLSQISKRHLFLPDRISLRFRAFFSRIPLFFKYLYQQLHRFITHDLYDEFTNHIHSGHRQINAESDGKIPDMPVHLRSIQDVLIGHGLLSNGQTLEEFVRQQITDSHYVIVREENLPNPPDYTNPLHRSLMVARHFASFFVNVSEKNPIIGSLAMAAYLYGAGAIIAPQALTALLTKLHLKGLIYGIKPTQALGRWMSHGTTSEAISAAVTYWQSTVIAGDLDNFFIQAISILHEDPAQVAIIVALAMGLGYGLCKAIPPLQEEMGQFPYINYAALGAKGGAAIYDTVMHPGDDWLLGTLKWLLRGSVTIGKLVISPFVEGYYYGFRDGFFRGWKKSGILFIQCLKQIFAATFDLVLAIATIPLLELSALIIHVPFRGITNLLSKFLGIMGEWTPIGQALIDFSNRNSGQSYLPGFRLSPLYGFTNPISHYHRNMILNIAANTVMLFFLPAFQLLKNFIVLPVLDVLSFTTRVFLNFANPVTRLLAFGLGKTITTLATFWDNSLGYVFRFSAFAVTLSSNWIDRQAGHIKQFLLGQIQIMRKIIYHWAFLEENLPQHGHKTDIDYFMKKPIRLEYLPHESTRCFLKILQSEPSSPDEGNHQENCHHSPVFLHRREERMVLENEQPVTLSYE